MDCVTSARCDPLIVANPFGVSDDGLLFAELTMLSEVKDGGTFSSAAHKQERKRNAASSTYAAVTRVIVPRKCKRMSDFGCRISGASSQPPALATSQIHPKSDIRNPK